MNISNAVWFRMYWVCWSMIFIPICLTNGFEDMTSGRMGWGIVNLVFCLIHMGLVVTWVHFILLDDPPHLFRLFDKIWKFFERNPLTE